MRKSLLVLAAALALAAASPALAQDAAVEIMLAQAGEAAITSSTEQAAPDPGAVTAPPDNTWTIPYGSMIDGAAQIIKAAMLVVIGFFVTRASMFLPMGARLMFNMFMSSFGERLIQNSIDFAINSTKGATKDGVLNIKMGSEVLARSAEYATQVGWKHLIDYLGGLEGVKQKAFRKLNIEPHGTAEQLGVKPVTAKPVKSRWSTR